MNHPVCQYFIDTIHLSRISFLFVQQLWICGASKQAALHQTPGDRQPIHQDVVQIIISDRAKMMTCYILSDQSRGNSVDSMSGQRLWQHREDELRPVSGPDCPRDGRACCLMSKLRAAVTDPYRRNYLLRYCFICRRRELGRFPPRHGRASRGFVHRTRRGNIFPVSTTHFYSICSMLDQRRRRWADVGPTLYKCYKKCFVFTGSRPDGGQSRTRQWRPRWRTDATRVCQVICDSGWGVVGNTRDNGCGAERQSHGVQTGGMMYIPVCILLLSRCGPSSCWTCS